nr:MAG TPA: hypothetical protein [Bacteriophage sp.]
MITIGNTQFRNLEEQVLKNKNDIKYILNEQGVLNQFGIKVVAQVDYQQQLPTVAEYKQSVPNWEYGDTIAVGTVEPYALYILTRGVQVANDYWFEIGEFPLPGPSGRDGKASTIKIGPTTTTSAGTPAQVTNVGDDTNAQLEFYIPQGKQGIKGDTGNGVSSVVLTTEKGLDFTMTDGSHLITESVEGPQGPQGEAGKPGDSFKIIGSLSSTNQLPNPSESIRTNSYLIPDSTGINHLWVITGEEDLLWTDAGAITGVPGEPATISVGTTVTLPAGSNATVTNSGTTKDAVFNFGIPKGKDGQAATISVGTVSTLPAGSNATVTNIGTTKDAVLNFGIPKGDKGATGDTATFITIDSPASATSGTITDAQLATLRLSKQNYIKFNNEIYKLNDDQLNSGYLIYSHIGQDNSKAYWIKEISITISTLGWVLSKMQPQAKLNFDTTPIQNSLNPVTSGGIFNAISGKVTMETRTGNASMSDGKVGAYQSIDFKIDGSLKVRIISGVVSPKGTDYTVTPFVNCFSDAKQTMFTSTHLGSNEPTCTLQIGTKGYQSFHCTGKWQTKDGQGTTTGDQHFEYCAISIF